MHGAALLDGFGRPGGDEWRTWADRLRRAVPRRLLGRRRGRGRYPAIALDARRDAGRLGDLQHRPPARHRAARPADEARAGRRPAGRPRASLAASACARCRPRPPGTAPLSYHGGSVWPHDTAIAVHGLAATGLPEDAAQLADGLLAAAERLRPPLPELYGGDAARRPAGPVPYPAACRPQAWSAAARSRRSWPHRARRRRAAGVLRVEPWPRRIPWSTGDSLGRWASALARPARRLRATLSVEVRGPMGRPRAPHRPEPAVVRGQGRWQAGRRPAGGRRPRRERTSSRCGR